MPTELRTTSAASVPGDMHQMTKDQTMAQALAEQMDRMTSAEQLSRDLLALTLERGGSDNVTILVGRAPRRLARGSKRRAR